MWIEQFGGANDGVTSNTAAYNAWLAAAIAGRAPKTLRFGNGTYLFSTKPNRIEDTPGIRIIGSDYTVATMGFTCADETEALLHFYGGSPFGRVERMALGTADNGSSGGSLIRFEATASAAPSSGKTQDVYLTSYASVSAQVISAITNAAEGVFTVSGHGYANGAKLVLDTLDGGTMYALNGELVEVSDAATDTFKLKHVDTKSFITNDGSYTFTAGAYVNTSALGTYSASTGTVKAALCADAMISIDGTAKSTGAQGVRITDVIGCTVFGGRRGGIVAKGYRALNIVAGNASNAGWNARHVLTGSASVQGQSALLSSHAISSLWVDRAVQTCADGAHLSNAEQNRWTANSGTPAIRGPLYAGVDYIQPSGDVNLIIANSQPAIDLSETDQSPAATARIQVSGRALLLGMDEANASSNTAVIMRADGANKFQVGPSDVFTSVPIYPLTDDAIDLGAGSFRYDDIFATNTTIQSSDRAMKQDDRLLSDAELAAACDIAKLIRAYRFKSSAAEKGDEARWHTGVIAQDVAAALEARGLDPWVYAFLCKDLIEWRDPQSAQREAIAAAPAKRDAADAELAEMEASRAAALETLSEDVEGEQRREIARIYDGEVASARRRRDAYAAIAALSITPAPDYFAPFDRWSLRYVELMLWIDAAQEQRLDALAARLDAAGIA